MTKSPHQSARIYECAMAHYRLAAPAFEDDRILVPNVMAVVVNLALCVELLLKASDAKVTPSPRVANGPLGDAKVKSKISGHDLSVMFEKISPEVQHVLKTLFEEETNKPLLPLLNKCKDYFIHARYYYEPEHHHAFDVGGIKMLADGLNIAMLKGWGRVELK
jgi:hypothetical protein